MSRKSGSLAVPAMIAVAIILAAGSYFIVTHRVGVEKQNKKIVGYGAAAKGNTLLQYFGIGTEIIDYIADTTAFKQGKFTPGTHIPILPPEHIKKNLPDYVLILAWNYASSIMKNESWLKNKNVKFIVPIPKVTIT